MMLWTSAAGVLASEYTYNSRSQDNLGLCDEVQRSRLLQVLFFQGGLYLGTVGDGEPLYRLGFKAGLSGA